jgi:hypothetical protein
MCLPFLQLIRGFAPALNSRRVGISRRSSSDCGSPVLRGIRLALR